MKQKDLAEEYARKAFLKRNRNNPMSIYDLCFNVTDIESAFNAGRESVVESMPKLKWNDFSDGLENYYASCPIGWCYNVSYKVNEFELFCNGCFIGHFFSIEAAKQAANEDYKKRIKQALGLYKKRSAL